MTEVKRIQKGIAREGRTAYNNAKKNSNAFITLGNSIYRMSADGSREKVSSITSTRVKVKCKKFAL